MSPRLRFGVIAVLGIAVVTVATVLSWPLGTSVKPSSSGPPSAGGSGSLEATAIPSPTPRPGEGGTELYGFVPYWQMTETVARYLDDASLSTVALFSVSARRNGEIDARAAGYKRIDGEIGRRIIADAHARGARVELVFSSFGPQKNGIFFGRLAAPGRPAASPLTASTTGPEPSLSSTASPAPASHPWEVTVVDLALLVQDLGLDGVNVDVEQLDELDREAYGEFLVALRSSLRAVLPGATVSVATEAGLRGMGNAVTASQSGVDRIFLMGYDYHWSGSQPGASAPVDRSDGLYTLRWSIEQYVNAGVPRDHILLGLPLYGMTWRTLGPDRTSPVIGRGATWIPNRHTDVLLDPSFVPGHDPLEHAEFYVQPDGDAWRITYYDSPATLRSKLALARDQGLAGGGFWALGYERGLPGYLDLMREFRAGSVGRDEAPPPP